MSPTNSLATAGLTVLGLVFGPTATLMMAFAADPKAEPRTSAPAASHAPSTPPPSAEREWSVLLKTNGQVVQGKITRTDSGYRLRTKVGEIPYGRREVEAVFGSMVEAYEYKNSRTPTHDPDERMKLAQWCLTNGLTDQARVEVQRVLELSPENPRARGMLFQMESVAARETTRDEAVIRSSVEMPRPRATAGAADPDTPGVLDLNDLREQLRRNPRAGDVPVVIFDLPEPQAIRRYQEFARRVHPILQKQCAGCHNERTPGSFPLLQTKSRYDLANGLIIRANLDATLRLVNPDDPAKSALLTSSLMPHPPKNQPIFLGPNQLAYRELSAWVKSLKDPSASADPAVREASFQPGQGESQEGFAVGRREEATPVSPAGPKKATAPRANLDPNRPDPEYPTDPLFGGADAAKIQLRSQPAVADEESPKDTEETPTIKVGGEEIPVDTRADPRKAPKAGTKKAKPKLDPAALRRLMQQRNSPR